MRRNKKVFKSFGIAALLISIILIFSKMDFYPQNPIPKQDSILVKHIIYSLINDTLIPGLNNVLVGYKEDLGHPFFSLDIENVYYSPDSLKGIIYLSLGWPNYDDLERTILRKPSKLYSAKSFAMLRSSKTEAWQLYPLYHYAPTGWSSREEIRILMERYWHSEILSTNELVNNPRRTEEELYKIMNNIYDRPPNDSIWSSVRFNYRIQDPDFWTKSVIWTKGLRRKGYYNFQTSSHIYRDDQVIKYNVQIPDSIKAMYKK